MDQDRFDDLAQSVAEGSSRRSIFKGIAGGSLAALLAAVGFGTVGVEDAEAGRCERRCRRRFDSRSKRRRCIRRKCRGGSGGGGTGGGGGGGGDRTGKPQPVSTNPAGNLVGDDCTQANDCVSGSTCKNNTCRACTTTCDNGTECCITGFCDVLCGQNVCLQI